MKLRRSKKGDRKRENAQEDTFPSFLFVSRFRKYHASQILLFLRSLIIQFADREDELETRTRVPNLSKSLSTRELLALYSIICFAYRKWRRGNEDTEKKKGEEEESEYLSAEINDAHLHLYVARLVTKVVI